MFVFIRCFPYCTSLVVLKVLRSYMKLADKFPERPLNTENVQLLMLVPTICLRKKKNSSKMKQLYTTRLRKVVSDW